MDGPGEGQMMVRQSGEVQVRVKHQKYSELDIDGRETCLLYVCIDQVRGLEPKWQVMKKELKLITVWC